VKSLYLSPMVLTSLDLPWLATTRFTMGALPTTLE
jgi:hypothetical protein